MTFIMYTITTMYGRSYTDTRTRVFYTEDSYNTFMDSFVSDFKEPHASLSYILGLRTYVAEGLATTSILCEMKRAYTPVRELNVKREMAVLEIHS